MRASGYLRPLVFFTGLCLFLSSCAAVGPRVIEMPPQPAAPQAPVVLRHDMKHVVGPGETIWRISRMYNVPSSAITSANHITDGNSLRMGQILLIPDAAPVQPVINLIPGKKWRYIIIHHSATDQGSSLHFNKAHLAKGWDKGVGYDFVIDNASESRVDGQLEETPRWIKQEDGAHCKASDMNTKAIGICLVGNFNDEKVSRKQMETLVHLVRTLQAFYHIPTGNIIRHGHVPGAATDCPGKKFPWGEFIRKLE